jgi:biopolymer transport protein ExbB
MSMFSHIVRFFQGGGYMMYPIAVVLVAGLAIAVERWIYLTVTAAGNRTLWNEISPLLAQGNFRQAVQLTSKSKAAIGQILSYGLARIASARRREDIEKAMEESLMDIMPRLEKRTTTSPRLPISQRCSACSERSSDSSTPSPRWRPSIRRKRPICSRPASRWR